MGKSGDGMRFCGFAVIRLFDCSIVRGQVSEPGGWLVDCCGQGPTTVFVQTRVGAPGIAVSGEQRLQRHLDDCQTRRWRCEWELQLSDSLEHR